MRICSCGNKIEDGDLICSQCGKSVETDDVLPSFNGGFSDIAQAGAGGTETTTPSVEDKPKAVEQPKPEQPKTEQPKPEQPKTASDDASTIFTMFEKPEDKPAEKKQAVKKPEFPKASSKIEVKPVANASGGTKLNPMKNPPPVESIYSVLSTGRTILDVFLLMLPVIGVVYAIILMTSAKKENVKILATAFLAVFLITVVLLAGAALVLMFFFEPLFNEISSVIEYLIRTVVSVIK